ncbi:MAG: FHA domain-containing protein [Candidatus Hydrogenedentes bacterium]|nr:FHA domain-containing protein [Candidatus Hydrogenedentota bacterium]
MAEGKCEKCGKAYGKTAMFCQKCGNKLHDALSTEDGEIKILNEEALSEAVCAEEEDDLFSFPDAAPPAVEDGAEAKALEASDAPAASVPVAPVPASDTSSYTLEILNGLSAGRKIRLDKSLPLTVGSSSRADLTVDDSSVSRRHATFRVEDGRLCVKDEGSTNKTLIYVDGEHALEDGDRLVLGDTLLKVVKE